MFLPKPSQLSLLLIPFYMSIQSILLLVYLLVPFLFYSLTPQLQLQFFMPACLFPYIQISNVFHSFFSHFFLSPHIPTPSTCSQTQSLPDEHSWSCLMEPRHICSLGPSSPGCCISPHWGAGHQEGPLTDVNSSIPGKPHASPRLNRASDHKL